MGDFRRVKSAPDAPTSGCAPVAAARDVRFERTASSSDGVKRASGLAARMRVHLGNFTSWLSSGIKKDYNITKTGARPTPVLFRPMGE